MRKYEKLEKLAKNSTKGPWLLSDAPGLFGNIAVDAADPTDGKVFQLCEVFGVDEYDDHDERSESNAAFIVEAKISVPELLADLDVLTLALEKISASYARLKPPGYPKSDSEKMAEAALSRVKGEA